MCRHRELHNAVVRYDRTAGELVYVMVCESCGSPLDEVLREPYRPAFDPAGNDPYLSPQLTTASASAIAA